MKRTENEHALDKYAKRGMSLFDNPAEAKKAAQHFEQRLAEKYPGSPKKRRIRQFMSIAAGILILLAVAAIFYNQSDKSTTLASEWVISPDSWNTHPQQPLAVAALAPNRDGRESAQDLLSSGRAAYAAQNFTQATEDFIAYLNASTEPRPEVILFLGHAQLQVQPKLAIETLKQFLTTTNLDEHYQDLAHWYKAWAHIRAAEPELAIIELEKIKDQASSVYSDAQHLLKFLLSEKGY